ncbi:MAG: cation-efflux pump [Candidatus Odinarchaeota archaeon]
METDKRGRKIVKRAAALSVLAALILTLLKTVIGVLTNSIGIISEALHSGLDLLAAAITFAAVRSASKEPDIEHQYGHGKIENFSALVETILLWITSAWIIYEALRRIWGEEFIEPTIWGIAVMLTSIFIDYERSRMLYRTAHKYNSQALEADALHFSTDMLSSVVVLLGLTLVSLGFPIGDPLGALGVSIVILFVSYNLAKRSFNFLVDRAPEGVKEKVIQTCSSIPGILSCSRVRVRTSGPDLFVDVIVNVDETVATGEAHSITETIESALAGLAPRVDVVVHVEPAKMDPDEYIKMSLYEQLQVLARREPKIRSVHNVRIFTFKKQIEVAADIEMSVDLTLQQAHRISDQFENEIKKIDPRINTVLLHLETTAIESEAVDITNESEAFVSQICRLVEKAVPNISCSNVTVREEETGVSLLIQCSTDGAISLTESHEISDAIEKTIMESISKVTHVFVHVEPL